MFGNEGDEDEGDEEALAECTGWLRRKKQAAKSMKAAANDFIKD